MNKLCSSWLLILFLVGCFTGDASAQQQVAASYPGIAGYNIPFWVALDTGEFKKAGLRVDPVLISGGSKSMQALLSGGLDFAHVSGGVTMRGGNGFFSTVEDNVIRGGATIDGYSGFWLGFIRNKVRGTVRLSNNVMDDPDANEYVTNTIKGNLICHGNSPAPQVGDSEGLPNVVSGRKVDQCAGL